MGIIFDAAGCLSVLQQDWTETTRLVFLRAIKDAAHAKEKPLNLVNSQISLVLLCKTL